MEILHTICSNYILKNIQRQNFRGTGAYKRILMAVNIHIAASSLTNAGFALATASLSLQV
jgi:hypothetical protein